MAKEKIENTMNEEEIKEEKSPGIFQKLFFWVLIPLLFVVAILLVVATFTNINVFEKATEILPFSKEEVPVDTMNKDEKIVELEAEIKEKEAEIETLQKDLDKILAENDNNIAKQEQLQLQIEELQRTQEVSKKEYAEIIKTYEQMSAKAVAPILTEMSEAEALKILSEMKPETLSNIFSKMDPADAAKFTEKLANQQNQQ